MSISHNYLPQQFANSDEIWNAIRAIVARGDFTLGAEVAAFEEEFAAMCGVKHAIGVGNGTDALFLALKALGVTHNSGEVITTPYSFYATTAAICNAGATPVFVDVGNDANIAPNLVEDAITPRTIGIVPVHWAGKPCNMAALVSIAERYDLWLLEDCAHAPYSMYHGNRCGSFGDVNAFSLHPLKNVNVWGDGGVITTNSGEKAAYLRKIRNHGMVDRNTVEFWGYNSRLDTVQAVVASHVLRNIERITAARRANAAYLNAALEDIGPLQLPTDAEFSEQNYYLYSLHTTRRDEMLAYLVSHGVDAKVHYPKPLHLQPAAKSLGYQKGDFPNAEWCANTTLSLPVHEFITQEQLERMVFLIREFFSPEQ